MTSAASIPPEALGRAPEVGGRGPAWQAAVHPDDRPKLMETWLEMVAAGKAGEFETRLRRHDGVFRWLLMP